MDGASGMVWREPPPETRAMLLARRQSWLDQRRKLLETSHQTTYTRDGKRIEVAANIGSLADARSAVHNGAEGVGLLRTEFLFLTRQTPLGEEEQVETLAAIAEALGSRPVIVRTLDAGGDKDLPYLHLPVEANPFLGVRAIRISLRNPELFTIQLRAILRGGLGHPFRIMFPMIATIEEIRQARVWLEKAHQELVAAGMPHSWPVETGMMVEIPAAALLASDLAPEVDFFSIGTNDLTQYTMAVERGNALLSDLVDALHPAVLRLIHQVAAASHAAGKWTGVCGELAGDLLAVPILIGLGVDELSLNPVGIPAVKDAVRKLDSQEAQSVAQAALKAVSANEVRDLARAFWEKITPPAG
jgi:phosphoenolpyruvate-protein phosphotransferase